MIRVLNVEQARADRPVMDRLMGVFTAAVKPQIKSELERISRETPLGEKIWGTVAGFGLGVLFRAVDILDGRPRSDAPDISLEDSLSHEFAGCLMSGWLRQMRKVHEETGNIPAGAVLPGDPDFAETWNHVASNLVHFSGIDYKPVLRQGLEELARTPGDLPLPLGMTIERRVLDQVLLAP